MVLGDFAQEMQKRGCVADERNFCGTYMGYPFSSLFHSGTQGFTSFYLRVQFAQAVPGKMYKELRKEMRTLAKITVEKANPTLFNVLVRVEARQNFSQAFDALISDMVRFAKQYQLSAPLLCPVCQKPNCDSYAYYGISYLPVHKACMHEKAYKDHASVRQNQASGNYALGILGAFLGGILGMIPNIALIVFANYLVAMLCALMPFCAYWGYRIFRGKMTKAVPFIVIFVSILLTPVFFYLSSSLSFYKSDNFFIGPTEFILLAFEYPADIVPSFLQTTLFVGLGVVFVFSRISRGNAHKIKDANFSLATLRPIPGMEAPPLSQQPPPEQNAVQ